MSLRGMFVCLFRLGRLRQGCANRDDKMQSNFAIAPPLPLWYPTPRGGIIWPPILRIYKGGKRSCRTREESRRVPSGGSVQIAVKAFGL